MKILRLDLLAYGPFTRTSLDLAQGRQGFHIIRGPNEAGKSSMLRGLHALFYGIGAKTSDSFIHPYANLRIGARLINRRGEILEITRRKANQQALRAGDDRTVVEEQRLTEFLGGVPADLFKTMFAIDHETLRHGGRDIATGNGSIGSILFAAGAGTADLRTLEQRLTALGEALFKPKAHKPIINADLARLRDLQSTIRQAKLPCDEWSAHHQALLEAQEKRAELLEELADQKRHRTRLDRLANAAPLILERRRILDELGSLGDVVMLADSFSERRQTTLTALAVARQSEATAARDLALTERSLAELPPVIDLADEAELVSSLAEQLGSHRKAQRDVVHLQSECKALEQRLHHLLRELRPDLTLDQIDALRLDKRERIEVRNLATQAETLLARHTWAREELAKLGRRQEELAAQLGEFAAENPGGDELESLRGLLEHGDPEESLSLLRAEVETLTDQANVELSRVQGWSKSLAELEQLSIPSPEILDEFSSYFAEVDRQQKELHKQQSIVDRDLAAVHREIDALHALGDVPTEQELKRQRDRRDQGWQLVRKSWLDREENPSGIEAFRADFQGLPLADAFADSIRVADDVADRLRRDASRVATLSQLVAREARLQQERETLETQVAALAASRVARKEEWCALWTALGVTPRSPREMAAFCRAQQELSRQAAEIRRRQVQVKRLEAKAEALRSDLSKCLATAGVSANVSVEPIAGLLRKGRSILEKAQAQAHLRQELARVKVSVTTAASTLQTAAEALESWKLAWGGKMAMLGLPENATAAQANEALDQVATFFTDWEKWQGLKHRIDAIRQDADAFTAEVTRLQRRLLPDSKPGSAESVGSALLEELKRIAAIEQKRSALRAQQAALSARRQQAQATILEMQARLEALCEEARCEHPDELGAAIERSEATRRSRARREQVEAQLARFATGTSLEELEKETAEIDTDRIAHDLERLDERIVELDRQRSILDQQIAVEQNELSKMDGSSAAAAAAEEAQAVISRIGSNAAQYAKYRLASIILQRAVESYREKNQGPILKRASELFAEMTLGSFTGLQTEFDEKGTPILVGVRADGTAPINVDGMSDGTVDQLYLALRLASLELHFERAEPLPFIIDDVLVNFDDDRALALLRILGDFSKRTQILFFTHHEHLVELACKHLGEDTVFTHELRGPVEPQPTGYLFADA